ncbi:MAG: diacylglycerol kinase family lipid kinase [Leptospiraceae bacterium]|nr:diacylglycerol kinase family lipid kinase [Leptospiraceae bacterium]
MTRQKIHFIINPRSAGGSTGKGQQVLLEQIQRLPGEVSHSLTQAQGHATELAAAAVQSGVNVIAVAGGDGTISEVVSGILQTAAPKKPAIVVINRGTGGDFCRSLGVPSDLSLALEQIQDGRDMAIDAGRIQYQSRSGQSASRYFVNVAGCGMAGAVVEAINKSSKRFGGLSYFLTSSQVLWRYRNRKVRIQLDDGDYMETKIVTVAICNGQFFGGGMQIGPEAQLSDGQFDVVILGNWNKLQSLWYSKNLYNGSIHRAKKVSVHRASKVRIEPLEPGDQIYIDCDGEDVGFAPVEIELLPKAVTFRI